MTKNLENGIEPAQEHSSIAELWKLYNAAQSVPNFENFSTFEILLRQTITSYLESPNTVIRIELAQIWVYKTELALDKNLDPPLSRASANRFLGLVGAPGAVEKLVEAEDKHRVIACASLYTACPSVPLGRFNTLTGYDIAQRWLGEPLPSGANNNLAALTDFIYGTGVWDLYRSDVVMDTELGHHLYRQNVPLRGKLFTSNLAQTLRSTSALPHDLT